MRNTKDKLLQTAAKMFAQNGIDGVSTRDLAKESGVNLCSINYYFGSKQKLYEAVMDDVYAHIQQNFIKSIKNNLQNPSSLPPKEEIKFIIGNFFDFLCSGIISDTQAELLVKEMFNPTAIFDKFYYGVFEPIHKHLSALIASIWKLEPDADRAILQAHMLLGQAIIFRIHREALLRRLKLKKYDPEIVNQIKQQLLQNCETLLTAGETK